MFHREEEKEEARADSTKMQLLVYIYEDLVDVVVVTRRKPRRGTKQLDRSRWENEQNYLKFKGEKYTG